MNKRVLSTLLLTLIGIAAYAAQPGTKCQTAKPLGDNFMETITGPFPKTVWYTARTFDLPLSVYFIPSSPSDPKPEVEMDFSCTSGVYEDSIICSLFCENSGSGIQLDMPHRPGLKTSTTDDGDFCYYLAMGKEYRDLLLKTGIDYNVDVVVKVTYKSAGTIQIAPDDMFTSCMDGAKFMHLGDTIHVAAQDANRHVIVPYVQWQNDSIRYVWDGDQPCILAIGNECDFDPRDYADAKIIDRNFDGGDTLKVTSELLHDYVSSPEYPNEAGMYFVKCYSEGQGVLKIEKVPMAPPAGDATLLRYDTPTPVKANDWDALYAIPYTWDTAVIFTAPTDHIFRMYIGATYDFTKENAIASYRFHKNEAGRWIGIQTEEMKALWAQAVSQYLYVRFECSAKTSITPRIWDVPACLDKWTEIQWPSSTLEVERGKYGAVYYRFYFPEWKSGDMTLSWTTDASGTCPTFFGSNCSFGTTSGSGYLRRITIQKNGSFTIPAADLAAWEKKTDDDGYLYIRFHPGNAGTVTITTTAPEEVDPAPVVYPAATVSVTCDGEQTSAGKTYIVRVSVPQTLNLYSGPADNIASQTPIRTWSQAPGETHSLTLQTGTYTLMGPNETIQIEVQ